MKTPAHYLFGAIVTSALLVSSITGRANSFSFDSLNRVSRVDYDNGTSIAYTYDAAGNRLTLVAQGGGTPDPIAPVIHITSEPATVPHSITSRTITGTNSAHVIGDLYWTNSLGGGGTFAAVSPWSVEVTGLSVGTNLISITGTNLLGESATGTAQVTRVRAPVLDITNATATVRYTVQTYRIGGTHLDLIGPLRWTNALTGIGGTSSLSNPFSVTGIVLAVGENVIGVSGTNAYGDAAEDSVAITRGPLGTGLPSVGVSSALVIVPNSITSRSITGTNSAHVIGTLYWTNSLGGGGSFAAVSPWSVEVAGLSVGTNLISITGTNLLGESATATARVKRVRAPVLNITNANATVRYTETTYRIGGTHLDLAGPLRWTNALTGMGGTRALSNPFSVTGIVLAVGENVIGVSGTNTYGDVAEDSVAITRGPLGTGLPFVDIATEPVSVSNSVTSQTISGTNNAHVIGTLYWTNSLGGGGSLAAVSPWSVEVAGLSVGTNLISITGTNMLGESAIDTVAITREQLGTGLPSVDITSEPVTVPNSVSSWTISGMNSVNVIGDLYWTNSLGGGGSFAAVSPWSVEVAGLSVGTNLISITGTNLLGESSTGTAQVTRVRAPVLDITNANATVRYTVQTYRIGGTHLDLIGPLRWTNALTGIGGTSSLSNPFSVTGIVLAVGENVIGVSSTNAYGDVAEDSVAITRGPLGTGLPSVGVSGALVIVPNSITSRTITGTNSAHVIGDLYWTNSLGGGGSFAAVSPWSLDVAGLSVGTNLISITGTNLLGESATATARVKRVRAPILDITNANATVRYTETTYRIGGTHLDLAGPLRWTNALTGLGGTSALSNPFSVTGIVLAVGENFIGVSGTNAYGDVAEDSVAITRGPLGTGLPAVDIATEPVSVSNSVTSQTISGTNNAHVIGDLYWTNSLGGGGSFAAVSPWSVDVAGLSVGTNLISITGTNLLGESASDTVAITREQLGAGLPSVDIISEPATVPNSVTSWTITGMNSANVIGDLYWTNGLGGEGSFAAISPWSVEVSGLSVGTNLISITGTNLLGESATGTAQVTRVRAPVLDITNANATVRYTETTYRIGGTHLDVIGPLRWTNALTGMGGTRALSNPFSVTGIVLAVGENVIGVSGTNAYGDVAEDSVAITRGPLGTGLPSVGVSSATVSVAHSVTSRTITGTNSAHVIGILHWTNSLGGGGSFAAVSPWSLAIEGLNVGTNLIRITGTNLLGESATGTARITRVRVPVLDITNANATVRYTETTYRIGGTHLDLTGLLHWTNALTGMGGTRALSNPFSATGIVLAVGENTISLRGKNAYGDAAEDAVVITRGPLGTGLPSVDITSHPESISNSVTSRIISGVVNAHVIGDLYWTNSLGGGSSFAAVSPWSAEITDLSVGMNLIRITGTNLLGESAYDTVIVTRHEVEAVNHAPYWTSTPVTRATVGQRYVYRLRAIDPNDDPLVFLSTNLPPWLQVMHDSSQVFLTNIITTVAGSGINGYDGDGGQAVHAKMASPRGVVFDASGNLYVSDYLNHRIRRITTNGIITTIAGTGDTSYNGDGIAATNASLNCPNGLAMDLQGRLYIADQSHHRIRCIGAGGNITTVAGTGIAGFSGDGNAATNACLDSAADIAFDAQGNLFIADQGNGRIRKVDINGIITTVAGDGTLAFNGDGLAATSSAINRPIGVTVSRQGVLYISECDGHRIRKVGPDGIMRNVAGVEWSGYNGDGIDATSAALNYPCGMKLDDLGNLYFTDAKNNRVRKVDTNGIITTVAGSGVYAFGGDDGPADNARLAFPSNLAFDRDGNLYVSDSGNNRVRAIGGVSGGWILAGTPASSDIGTTGVDLRVTDQMLVSVQGFNITVVELRSPTNLAAVATGLSSIMLSWTGNNSEESGYRIERRASGNVMWVMIAELPADCTTFVDSGLASGHAYYYRIYAVNPDGRTEPSEPAFATTFAVPSTPQNLTAHAQATNRILLGWTDTSENETGFEIQRRSGAAGAWVMAASVPSNIQSYIDSGISANTLFNYRLRATNSLGVSAFSAEAGTATPPVPDEPDCGYEIVVTATNLTADATGISFPSVIVNNALIGGTLGIRHTSPRGVGSVQRVAMGFRNMDGQPVGFPREVTLLYGVPGCPGLNLPVVPVPDNLRTPEINGEYTLWIESYVTSLDPVVQFRSQIRTDAGSLACRIGAVTVQSRPTEQVEMRIMPAQGAVGQSVTVPIMLNSTGGINSAGFSVVYDSAILSHPRVLAGSDAMGIWPVVNTGTTGRVGVLLLMPDDQSVEGGTRHVADMVFNALTPGECAVTFADVPVPRAAVFVDPEITPDITWADGSVRIMVSGYEGDIAPRPGGDLSITSADVLVMQLIVAGLEPLANSNEFRKADCSPRATFGNGRVDVADLRQVMRYQSGADSMQLVGGPWTTTNGTLHLAALSLASQEEQPMVVPHGSEDRVISLADATVKRGDSFWLSVTIIAEGDESTLGFSLEFDPNLLTYLDARTVGEGSDGVLMPSLNGVNQGRAGFTLSMPNEQVLPAGAVTILEVGFASAYGTASVTTQVGFADAPTSRGASDINAASLSAAYTGAVVTLLSEMNIDAPDAPLNLTAQAVSTGQVHIAWSDDSYNETGFRVLRRTDAEPWNQIISLPPGTESYSDGGLDPNLVYRYVVEALNDNGSGFSNEAEARTWSRITAWRLDQFGTVANEGDAANAGDWDYDGVPNLIEYALGTDATDEYTPNAWVMEHGNGVQIGTNRFLTAAFDLGTNAATDVQIRMLVSTNLMLPWVTEMVPVSTTLSNGVRRVRVRSDKPLGTCDMEMMRMLVVPYTE